MLPTITFNLQSPQSNNQTMLPIKFVIPTNNNIIQIPTIQQQQQCIGPNKYVNNYVIDYNR